MLAPCGRVVAAVVDVGHELVDLVNWALMSCLEQAVVAQPSARAVAAAQRVKFLFAVPDADQAAAGELSREAPRELSPACRLRHMVVARVERLPADALARGLHVALPGLEDQPERVVGKSDTSSAPVALRRWASPARNAPGGATCVNFLSFSKHAHTGRQPPGPRRQPARPAWPTACCRGRRPAGPELRYE